LSYRLVRPDGAPTLRERDFGATIAACAAIAAIAAIAVIADCRHCDGTGETSIAVRFAGLNEQFEANAAKCLPRDGGHF
jgi:hypothetical protein